jgi:hypothetical protein
MEDDKRWCLMINLDEGLMEQAKKISIKYKISNPKNSSRSSSNAAEVFRLLLHYCIKQNKIKSSAYVEENKDLKKTIDQFYSDIDWPEMADWTKRYIDKNNKIQIRVTEDFHAAVMRLSTAMAMPYGDIARVMMASLCNQEGGAR